MPSRMIVVGIDFSEPAGRALEESRNLARRLDAQLDLIHVTPEVAGEPWAPGADESGWLERAGVNAHSVRIRRGTPWVELARVAAEQNALLVAIGSHGHGGYQPVSLGSTASRLTLGSSRPVLVIGRRNGGRTILTAAVGS